MGARDLLFKRAKEVAMPVPEKKEEQETKKEKKSEDVAPKTKKDAEPSIPSTTEVEPQESAAEASFEPFNNNLWLENFESLMADASLYQPDRGPHHRTILTRVQRNPRR